MRPVRLTVAACLFATIALAGCGASTEDVAPGGPLVGEWVDTSGSAVRFTGDVFFTSAVSEARDRFRYRVVSGGKLSLTPIVVQDGVELDQTDRMRLESYTLDGDTLTLASRGTYYRQGSAALTEALASSEASRAGQASSAQARLALDACRVVRDCYSGAFDVWFEQAYPDRQGYGYTIGQYIRYKRLNLKWGFEKLKREVGAGYAAVVQAYESDVLSEEYASKPEFIAWIESGVCPSSGTYKTVWKLDSERVPRIFCSVHEPQK